MATVEIDIVTLIPKLETRIKESYGEYLRKYNETREAVLAPLRGQRHWWFGDVKTDAELVQSLDSFSDYFWAREICYPKARDTAIAVHTACCNASGDTVTLTDKECRDLVNLGVLNRSEGRYPYQEISP